MQRIYRMGPAPGGVFLSKTPLLGSVVPTSRREVVEIKLPEAYQSIVMVAR